MTFPVICSGVLCWMAETAKMEKVQAIACPTQNSSTSAPYCPMAPTGSSRAPPPSRQHPPTTVTSRLSRRKGRRAASAPAASPPSRAASPMALSAAP